MFNCHFSMTQKNMSYHQIFFSKSIFFTCEGCMKFAGLARHLWWILKMSSKELLLKSIKCLARMSKCLGRLSKFLSILHMYYSFFLIGVPLPEVTLGDFIACWERGFSYSRYNWLVSHQNWQKYLGEPHTGLPCVWRWIPQLGGALRCLMVHNITLYRCFSAQHSFHTPAPHTHMHTMHSDVITEGSDLWLL